MAEEPKEEENKAEKEAKAEDKDAIKQNGIPVADASSKAADSVQ